MGDSFFTSRNHFDPQIEAQRWDPVSCTLMIEASARRMVRLSGTIEASKQLQRVADICAGAYVLPVEHWRKLGRATEIVEATPKPPTALSRKSFWRLVVVDNRGFWFSVGVWLGLFWESLWR